MRAGDVGARSCASHPTCCQKCPPGSHLLPREGGPSWRPLAEGPLVGGSCLPSAMGRTPLFRLTPFPKRHSLFNLGDHCIRQTSLLLVSPWHYQLWGKHPVRRARFGHSAHTHRLRSHSYRVTCRYRGHATKGGRAIPAQKTPSVSPVKADLVGTETELVFLHPVSTLDITWEDFVCGKVNQVQNIYSKRLLQSSFCHVRQYH